MTKAALRLGIRQPSVSLALQRLEEELDCQLIHRDSRNFELTLRGDRVFRECAEIVLGVDRIRALTIDKNDETLGLLKLHIISNLNSPLIDEAIRLLHQRSPSISWQIEVTNSSDIVRMIAQEQANLGICLLNKPALNLDCKLMFRVEYAIFCGKEHPLYGTATVNARELQQEPFVSFACASDGMGLEPVSVLREDVGLGGRVLGSSPNLEEVRRMIITGLGIGVLPISAVHNQVSQGLLWPLSITDRKIGADVYLVKNPKLDLSAVEELFVGVIDELLELEERETPTEINALKVV